MRRVAHARGGCGEGGRQRGACATCCSSFRLDRSGREAGNPAGWRWCELAAPRPRYLPRYLPRHVLPTCRQASVWQRPTIWRCSVSPNIEWNFAHHLADELVEVVDDDEAARAGAGVAAGRGEGRKDASDGTGGSAEPEVRVRLSLDLRLGEAEAEDMASPLWWQHGHICYSCGSRGRVLVNAPDRSLHHRFVDCKMRKEVRCGAERQG